MCVCSIELTTNGKIETRTMKVVSKIIVIQKSSLPLPFPSLPLKKCGFKPHSSHKPLFCVLNSPPLPKESNVASSLLGSRLVRTLLRRSWTRPRPLVHQAQVRTNSVVQNYFAFRSPFPLLPLFHSIFFNYFQSSPFNGHLMYSLVE